MKFTVAFLSVASVAFAQGPLTPPAGAPAPSMKTLQQIEPRIDLQNAPASAVNVGDSSYHYIINQPGSYYLSAKLGVTKANGIQINAAGVTLDLNGFEISRTSGTGGYGIEIAESSHRTSLRNGAIRGFAYGVNSIAKACGLRDLAVSSCTLYGIFAGEQAVLEACRAHDNSGTCGIFADSGSTLANCSASANTVNFGINVGAGSALSNCSASINSANTGINAGGGSSLENCSAYGNIGGSGISTGSGCTLLGCSAYLNRSSDPISGGIFAGSGSTVSHCSSFSNTSTAATSTGTTGLGFNVGVGGSIQNCTAYSNEGDGIRLSSGGTARDNTCRANGSLGDGAGIHTTASDNRIEGNNVTTSDRGIDVDAARNIIVRNTASGNMTNYDIAADNVFGGIVDRSAVSSAAVNGNSAPSSAVTTDPWANFTY